MKQIIYSSESRHLKRLIITSIAVLTVLTAVIVKAKLLGEFAWHIGSVAADSF